MRLLIVDTYYEQFLEALYRATPGLSSLPYGPQLKRVLAESFGTADFYSSGLKSHGSEAQEIIANSADLQVAWVAENDPVLARVAPARRVPKARHLWFESVLRSQVRAFSPDVVLIQNVDWPTPRLLKWLGKNVHYLVAQHGSSLRSKHDFRPFDLVLSYIPKVIDFARRQGARAEELHLGFGHRVLERIGAQEQRFDVIHIGGYGRVHEDRNKLLEHVQSRTPCRFWGYGIDHLPTDSPILRSYEGEAWGLEMYRIRAAARLTITGHIRSVVGNVVGNMTMYEVTGVGGCLVVDQGSNLSDLFDPELEVVGYSSKEEAVEKISYLLEHEDLRRTIAEAGRRRTLRDHTYEKRMGELLGILESLP